MVFEFNQIDRRSKRCTTPHCKGVLYSDGEGYIYCTNCDFKVYGKRLEDKKLMTLPELKREFNGN